MSTQTETKEGVIARYKELGIEENKIFYSEYPVCFWSSEKNKVIERGEQSDDSCRSVSLQLHTILSKEIAAEINAGPGIIVTKRSPSTGNLRWTEITTPENIRTDAGLGYVEMPNKETRTFGSVWYSGNVERVEAFLGPMRILCELKYVGDGDPVSHLNKAVKEYVGDREYNEFIDANMDNPWVRVIIMKTGYGRKIH